MDMATLGPLATKAAVNCSTIIGRKLLTRYQRNKIATEAAGILVAGNTERFIEHLDPQQLRRFREFAESAQFDHLVRQAMISSLASTTDETRSVLREQLRHGLRHHGEFAGADLVQATDVLHELVDAAVHAVRLTAAPGTLDSGRAVAMAARVAAAGVLNSELLDRLKSLDEIDQFAKAVRSATKAGHAKLRMAAHDLNRQVDYAQLYVTPGLRPAAASPLWDSSTSETFALADGMNNAVRFVILGDPGAGKSTLAAKLAHDLAADKIGGLEGQVPILLVVRAHTQSLRTDHHTLLHYLEAACRRPGNVNPPPDALEYLLLNGRATVIIDGIDELGDSSYRQSFAQLVDGFAHRYPLARVIATSRVVGYPDAPLDSDLFPTVDIAPFNETQVNQYANRWFRLDTTLGADQRRQLTEAFMRESEVARDLRVNPLVLSLLCGLYSTVHYIPRNKPEIYEKCAELLFETWDRSRGIDVTHRYGAHIRPAVQRLAWRLFTDPQGRQALRRAELIAFLAEYMKTKRFEDPDEAAQAAADFLDFCAGRAWVLTDMGSDALQPHYGFVHRTFLEFFAASQLVKHQPDPEVVWSQLEPHLLDSTWDVVGQLAVQILDRHCDDGADRVLRLALARVDEVASASVSHLSFAARCMENVAPDNTTLRDVVTRVVARSCAAPAADRRRIQLEVFPEEDIPLSGLLAVTAPDNAARIARAIADAVERNARVMPLSSSAGLLYEMLLNQPIALTDGTGELIKGLVADDLSQRAVPETARMWHRLIQRPTADDLAERGLPILYELTYVAGAAILPVLTRILAETVAPPVGQTAPALGLWDETLEAYYPQIIANRDWLSRAALPQNFWDRELPRFDEAALREMSKHSRASLILLLLPIMRVARRRPHVDQLEQFMTATEGSYHEAAIDIVNSWALPAEAHDFLVEWVRRPG
ncbi:NACHT domain-containing protein [Micromonospora sp. RTP1Z1]|uniref:NACHT domain-containing protein n=1 Tax=Micromonospora sp. RTP1Z1 TaxID=2994043 RepID=UPI0029C67641|nr:NACHT domain-containing protein [Micromonospora sp. RTP1Z1]